jgi:hypothetical protein
MVKKVWMVAAVVLLLLATLLAPAWATLPAAEGGQPASAAAWSAEDGGLSQFLMGPQLAGGAEGGGNGG